MGKGIACIPYLIQKQVDILISKNQALQIYLNPLARIRQLTGFQRMPLYIKP